MLPLMAWSMVGRRVFDQASPLGGVGGFPPL